MLRRILPRSAVRILALGLLLVPSLRSAAPAGDDADARERLELFAKWAPGTWKAQLKDDGRASPFKEAYLELSPDGTGSMVSVVQEPSGTRQLVSIVEWKVLPVRTDSASSIVLRVKFLASDFGGAADRTADWTILDSNRLGLRLQFQRTEPEFYARIEQLPETIRAAISKKRTAIPKK